MTVNIGETVTLPRAELEEWHKSYARDPSPHLADALWRMIARAIPKAAPIMLPSLPGVRFARNSVTNRSTHLIIHHDNRHGAAGRHYSLLQWDAVNERWYGRADYATYDEAVAAIEAEYRR